MNDLTLQYVRDKYWSLAGDQGCRVGAAAEGAEVAKQAILQRLGTFVEAINDKEDGLAGDTGCPDEIVCPT